MRKKSALTIVLLVVAIVAMGAVAKYIFTALQYWGGSWGTVGWGKAALYNFCKYELPSGYVPKRESYWTGWPHSEREMVFYKRPDTGQLLVFLKLPEHLSVSLDGVQVFQPELQETFRRFRIDIDGEFTMLYLLPAAYSDPVTPTPSGVWIHGINHNDPERWSTETAEIYYLSGHFQRVAWEKPRSWWERYPVQAIEFHQIMDGALAIVRHKEKGWTLFVVGAIPLGKNFNGEEFRQVLNSMTFDAEPYEAPTWEKIKPLPKGWSA